jgi:hypothetical protein
MKMLLLTSYINCTRDGDARSATVTNKTLLYNLSVSCRPDQHVQVIPSSQKGLEIREWRKKRSVGMQERKKEANKRRKEKSKG